MKQFAQFSLLALLALSVVQAIAQTTEVDRWTMLYTANDLDLEGSKPFHLQISFQLYSLAGKADETGTVEMWWYSQRDRHVVIRSHSLNSDSDVRDSFDEKTARESYLVNELLNFALRPVPKRANSAASALSEEDRSFGKASLTCLSEKPANSAAIVSKLPILCTEKGRNVVRVVLHSSTGTTFVRNSIERFGDLSVPLDMQVSMYDHQAITGKVTSMVSLSAKLIEQKPATPVEIPAKIAEPETAAKTVRIAGGVIAGARTSFIQPEYPIQAKTAHMTGTVLLSAVISRDGTIEHLVPLASTDQVFTDSALEAVKRWKYRPYLLNGEPAEVDTTITVNYALSGH